MASPKTTYYTGGFGSGKRVRIAGACCDFRTLNSDTYYFSSSSIPHVWSFGDDYPQFVVSDTPGTTLSSAWNFVHVVPKRDTPEHSSMYLPYNTTTIVWDEGVPTMPNLHGGDNYALVKSRATIDRSIEADGHRTYYIQRTRGGDSVATVWVSDFTTGIGKERRKRTNLARHKCFEYVCDPQRVRIPITCISTKLFRAFKMLRLTDGETVSTEDCVKLAILGKRLHGDIDSHTERYTCTVAMPELGGDATVTYERRRT